MVTMMGQTRYVLLAALVMAVATTSTGCRKLGLDDSPRTMPNDVPPVLGPKRAPAAQHSESMNTPEARKAMARGLISPDPAMQMSLSSLPSSATSQPSMIQQPGDNYGANAGNFWVNGGGWSNTPTVNTANMAPPPAVSAMPAMPSPPQPPMPMMMAPPPQQQAFAPPPSYPTLPPSLPPLSALSQAPQPYQIPQMQPSMQQPLQLTPPPPSSPAQMASTMPPNAAPMDFPQLQEIPPQPYYRGSNEIAADIAELQHQSQMAQSYQQPPIQAPQYPPQYQQQPTQPYPSAPPQMPVPASPVAMENPGYFAQANPMQPALESVETGWANNSGYAPAAMASAGSVSDAAFVPPAPVAGVADVPVMTQDWDTSAYRGGSQQQASTGGLQLRMPSHSAQFLPNSRYSGRRAPQAAPQAMMGYGY